MSHSQFHSTNLFILRHAWLNLWDKHMTTGRINQVTTFHLPTSQRTWSKRPLLMVGNHFRSREFINNGWRFKCSIEMLSIVYWQIRASKWITLFPDLTNFWHTSPCWSNRDRGLQRELHTTGREHPKNVPRTVMADSQVVNCNRFSYQQVYPHSSFIAST